MPTVRKPIHPMLYVASLVVWIASICCAIGFTLFNLSAYWLAFIIVAVIVEGILAGVFRNGRGITRQSFKTMPALERLQALCQYIALGVALVSFLSLLVAGGSPDMDGARYVVVNHGQIVRQVSQGIFCYLAVCETAFFSSLPVYATTYMARLIRHLYQNAD